MTTILELWGDKVLSEILKEYAANNGDISEIKDMFNQINVEFKKINNLQKSEILKWAQDFRNKSQHIDIKQHIPEILAKLKHAAYLAYGYYIWDTQLLSILLASMSAGNLLSQVDTGEGKSVIVSISAAFQVLTGNVVDIMTSNNKLVKDNYQASIVFFKLLGISVDYNTRHFDPGAKECYLADVVYGDITTFIGDHLKDTHTKNNTLNGRAKHVIIVDEVDSMLVDQNSNTCDVR